MSRGTPAQTNFNGGEISRRLRGRHDLSIYGIACEEVIGFAPLVEGGLDACPGFLRVAKAKGPCRLVEYTYNATQSYVIEMSAGWARFYTNDARIETAPQVPVELALPWTLDQIQALTWHKSYDVLYLFHGDFQTRMLVRTGADTFELRLLELENGPFEARNKDEGLTVTASGVTGTITLTASGAIFQPGDVGGLFQLEATDFGDIASWEPGIYVGIGDLLTWNDRVYRVVGGSLRTGSVSPVHTEGVEWDGIGRGNQVGGDGTTPANGCQLEYVCGKRGLLRITGYTSPTVVTALVLKTVPFTVALDYTYDGGYDPGGGPYVPPEDAVTYAAGTWRWRFGAFSNRRGWPTCGVIDDQRLVLAKGATVYGSVTGDLTNHATYNETGEISTDMAFVATIDDPNEIESMVSGDRLIILTQSGMHILGPSNQAQGMGPNNLKAVLQNDQGASGAMPALLDGRTIYIGNNRRKLVEADYSVERDRQAQLDLSRYARHVAGGGRRFTAVAIQRDPNHLLWACREDGTLASAVYLPEEQALGWWQRPLAPGMLATSLCGATDPAGENGELWIAASWRGETHVCLLAPWRLEGDAADPVMSDMALEYVGDPRTAFGPIGWLSNATVDIQADDRVYRGKVLDGTGSITLDQPASRVVIGLAFPARFRTLSTSSNGDNGPPRDKMKRASRVSLDVLESRGLRVSGPGGATDLESIVTDQTDTDSGFGRVTGIVITEDVGDWVRDDWVAVERMVPAAATVRAVQPTVDVQQR